MITLLCNGTPPPAPPFVKLKDVPQQIWWPALSFGLVWAKHSSGCGRQCNAVVQGERKAELLDISQGARVENQFPFHHDLSPVPTVVSSTTTSFLSHPHWAASAPLLSLPFLSVLYYSYFISSLPNNFIPNFSLLFTFLLFLPPLYIFFFSFSLIYFFPLTFNSPYFYLSSLSFSFLLAFLCFFL